MLVTSFPTTEDAALFHLETTSDETRVFDRQTVPNHPALRNR